MKLELAQISEKTNGQANFVFLDFKGLKPEDAEKNIIKNPKLEDYKNLPEILINIQKLKCDMYDDSIIPVALANKLVSLANHPSKVLLEIICGK